MSVLLTGRYGYTTLRDQTAYAATLDSSTAGQTYHSSDMPADAKAIGPEYNGAEIFFTAGERSMIGENTGVNDGSTFDGKLWGYSDGGHAEKIADISITAGTGRINDYTTALFIDTIVVDVSEHLTGTTIIDSGSQGIAKWSLDTIGYSHLYLDFTVHGTNDTNTSDVKAYIRPY